MDSGHCARAYRNFVAIALAAIVAMLCFSSAPARAQVVGQPQIMPGVEKWMREYQARMVVYLILYKPQVEWWEQEPAPYVWPSATDGTPAPMYPPDGFYAESMRRDADFARYLTHAMLIAFNGANHVPMWTDRYGNDYFGSALWMYFLRDVEPASAGGAPLSIGGHARFDDGQSKFTYNGEDFPAPVELVEGTSRFPTDVRVTSTNYPQVFEYLKRSVARLKKIDMPMGWTCPSDTTPYIKAYFQDFDNFATEALGSSTHVGLLYSGAQGGASAWWTTHTWEECPNGSSGSGSSFTVGVGPPIGLEVTEVDRQDDGNAGTTLWAVTTQTMRRAGYLTFDYGNLFSKYDVYVAVQPGTEGAAYGTNGFTLDAKYNLFESGEGLAKHQTALVGYDNLVAPISNASDVPTPPNVAPDPQQKFRVRGWSIWPYSDTMPWAFDGRRAALAVFTPDFDAMARRGMQAGMGQCSTCGIQSVPGAPRVEAETGSGVTSMSLAFGLGRTANGGPAGGLFSQSQGLSAASIRPELFVADIRPGASQLVSLPSSGNSRTRVVHTGRAVVVATDTTSSESGAPTASTTVTACLGDSATGEPYQTTVLEYRASEAVPDPAAPSISVSGKTVTVTTTGQCPSKSKLTQVGDNWEIATGFDGTSYLRRERIVKETNPTTNVTTLTHTVVGPDNAVATVSTESTKPFAWGIEVVGRTTGQTGNGMGMRGETYTYHEDATISGAPNPNYTHVKTVTTTEGAWTYFEYDDSGAVVTQVSQYANSAYGTNVSTLISQGKARLTNFTTSQPGVSSGSAVAQVAQTVEKFQGTAVARTCTLTFPPGQGKYAGTNEVETWTIRCAVPDAQSGTTLDAYLAAVYASPWTVADRVEIVVSESGDSQHRVKREMHADGSMALYFYTTSSTFERTTVVLSGPANSLCTGIRGGTQTTTITNAQGIQTSSVTEETDPSGSWITVGQTSVDGGDIDVYGHVSKVNHFDGTATQSHYECCGKDYTLDAQGVKTTYLYDALKREVSSSRQVGPVSGSTMPVITTITTYDADGRVLTESRKGTDDVSVLISHDTYDAGGRLISSKNVLNEETTYTEALVSNLVVSTEIMPDPDGSGSLSAPQTVRVSYPDGTPISVNVPFVDASSSSAPQQFSQGTTTLSGVGTVRTSTRYAFDGAVDSAYPRTTSYTDALGRTVQTRTSLSSSTSAVQTTSYDPVRHITRTIDPDGVKTFSVSGYGLSDAATFLNWTVPTELQAYFTCRWSLTALDVNGDDEITFSATSPAPADRITVTSSWLSTRLVGGVSTPVRHSASIMWKTDSSATSVIETSSSDSTLDGLKSWSMASGQTASTVTVNGTAQRTITSTDVNGAVTETKETYGRQAYTKRFHPGSVFAGKTEFEYDTHGRLSKTHLLHTDIAAWNGSDDDVSETTYGSADRVDTTTDPSPNGGTGTGGGTRHVTSYAYDHLGRVSQVTVPGSKTTITTYTARGQAATVRGFGLNPVDYTYDKLGRMIELATYQNVSGNQGKATTKWAYDPYSGRLLNKRYEGNTGTTPDLAYTYKPSGRPLTRTTKRGITTTYAYDASTGEPIATTYSDSTPATFITARDRFGRPKTMIDAAGLHSLTYTDDGRPWGEFITSDTGITGAPHQNILAGVSLINSFEFTTTTAGSFPNAPRESLDVVLGATSLNHVDFGYDPEERLNRVTKSGGRVDYAFDSITGQVTSSTSKFNTGGTTFDPRIQGFRGYDRLGRMTGIAWINVPPASTPETSLLARGYSTDIHGRRTAAVVGFGENVENWNYGYDDIGQLSSASGSFAYTSPLVLVPGLQFTYEHDDIGNRKNVVQGNSASGSDSYSASYSPNLLNQYTSRQVPGKIEVSGHSPATTVYVNSQAATQYPDFDGFFYKRLGVSNTGPVRQSVSIDEGQSVIIPYDVFVPAATESFSYDADGNLASDGIWNYAWDAENRLIQMTMKTEIAGYLVNASAPWQELKFAYDGMGRRIQKTLLNTLDYSNHVQKGDLSEVVFDTAYLHKYIYDLGSWNLSAIAYCNTSSGAIQGPDRSFAWGPDLSGTENGAGGIGGLAIYLDDSNDNGGGTGAIGPMFPLYDGNGNILRLYSAHVDSGGVPDRKMAEYQYGPFGEQRGQTGAQAARFPFRWSTKFTDNESGLVYYGYRYYSAGAGKWISRDPSNEDSGPNLTQYCGTSPIDSVDPIGLCDICDRDYVDSNLLPVKSVSQWRYDTRIEASLNEGLWATLSAPTVPIRTVQRQLALVYTHYGVLALQRPNEFVWAGAASSLGVDLIPQLTRTDGISGSTAAGIKRIMIQIAQGVFDDLAWQHHAYLDDFRGMQELRAHTDVGDIPPDLFFNGWCRLYHSRERPSNIMSGTFAIQRHEQQRIAQPLFSQIAVLPGITGQAIRWIISAHAASVLPGTTPFNEILPNGNFFSARDRTIWEQLFVLAPWGQRSPESRSEIVSDFITSFARWY